MATQIIDKGELTEFFYALDRMSEQKVEVSSMAVELTMRYGVEKAVSDRVVEQWGMHPTSKTCEARAIMSLQAVNYPATKA